MPKPALKTAPTPSAMAIPPPPATEHPVHRIQFGIVRGSIWKSSDPDKPGFKLTLDRVVTDKAKNEQVSQVFESTDVRHLSKVTAECARWIEWQSNHIAEMAARRRP